MLQILLLLSSLGASDVPCGVEKFNISVAELNHYYDENGKIVFHQVIWMDWGNNGHHVQAWKWLKDVRMVQNWSYFFVGGKLVAIRANSRSTTWTQKDPEVSDRSIRPAHQRSGFPAYKP